MLLLALPLALATFVSALGSACTAPLGAGTASPDDSYWQETISRNGYAPYSSNPGTYSVFRNVKVGYKLSEMSLITNTYKNRLELWC